jgi:hypothetical protein
VGGFNSQPTVLFLNFKYAAATQTRIIILIKKTYLRALECAHSWQGPMSLLYETYLCEVRTTDWPDFWIDANTVHRFRLATGSTPLVGSSRKTIGGFPIRAMAVLSLRLLPPLYVPHCWFSYSWRPIKHIVCSYWPVILYWIPNRNNCCTVTSNNSRFYTFLDKV